MSLIQKDQPNPPSKRNISEDVSVDATIAWGFILAIMFVFFAGAIVSGTLKSPTDTYPEPVVEAPADPVEVFVNEELEIVDPVPEELPPESYRPCGLREAKMIDQLFQKSDYVIEEAMALIGTFNTYSATPYDGISGKTMVGFDDTTIRQQNISRDEAYEKLRNKVIKLDQFIALKVKWELDYYQRAALISFVYNVGRTAFSESTLLKRINEEDIDGVMFEWMRWVNVNGNVVEGLKHRRMYEYMIWKSCQED